jgi:hypothetical protein
MKLPELGFSATCGGPFARAAEGQISARAAIAVLKADMPGILIGLVDMGLARGVPPIFFKNRLLEVRLYARKIVSVTCC